MFNTPFHHLPILFFLCCLLPYYLIQLLDPPHIHVSHTIIMFLLFFVFFFHSFNLISSLFPHLRQLSLYYFLVAFFFYFSSQLRATKRENKRIIKGKNMRLTEKLRKKVGGERERASREILET